MKTRLTRADYRQIEFIANAEVEARLGPPPTRETLDQAGYLGQRMLGQALDFIAGAGTVLTMLAAEVITAVAALALMVVFAALEAERIYSGALALGQTPDQARLIAVALVTGNAITPIYAQRNLRGQQSITRTRSTVRGWLEAFWRRVTAQPEVYQADVHDNPTLRVAKAALLWATIGFALLAVLGPMVARRAAMVWYAALVDLVAASDLAEFVQLVAGLLLAFGGVFFLQSAAHEVGVRVVTDRPASIRAVLEAKQREYAEAATAIRRQVAEEYAAAKLADEARRRIAEAEPARTDNGRGPFVG